MNKKQSSSQMATNASQVLRNKNSSAIQKELAASVLSQANSDKQTGSKMETTASNVLTSNKYSELTKSLAGSVLSQSNKERH